MGYLIDTNVISELRKGQRADANVRTWFEGLDDDRLYLSVLTIGELRRGVESIRRRDPRAAAALDAWVMQILALHADRVVPVDALVAEEWGRLNVPDPLPVVDGLLAATAKVHGMTLVTRNLRDVRRTGVEVVDPFS